MGAQFIPNYRTPDDNTQFDSFESVWTKAFIETVGEFPTKVPSYALAVSRFNGFKQTRPVDEGRTRRLMVRAKEMPEVESGFLIGSFMASDADADTCGRDEAEWQMRLLLQVFFARASAETTKPPPVKGRFFNSDSNLPPPLNLLGFSRRKNMRAKLIEQPEFAAPHEWRLSDVLGYICYLDFLDREYEPMTSWRTSRAFLEEHLITPGLREVDTFINKAIALEGSLQAAKNLWQGVVDDARRKQVGAFVLNAFAAEHTMLGLCTNPTLCSTNANNHSFYVWLKHGGLDKPSIIPVSICAPPIVDAIQQSQLHQNLSWWIKKEQESEILTKSRRTAHRENQAMEAAQRRQRETRTKMYKFTAILRKIDAEIAEKLRRLETTDPEKARLKLLRSDRKEAEKKLRDETRRNHTAEKRIQRLKMLRRERQERERVGGESSKPKISRSVARGREGDARRELRRKELDALKVEADARRAERKAKIAEMRGANKALTKKPLKAQPKEKEKPKVSSEKAKSPRAARPMSERRIWAKFMREQRRKKPDGLT